VRTLPKIKIGCTARTFCIHVARSTARTRRALLKTGTPFSGKLQPNHRRSLTSNFSVTPTYLSACNSWPTACSKTTSNYFPDAGIRGRRNCEEKPSSWVD